jgi:hypothetical protein
MADPFACCLTPRTRFGLGLSDSTWMLQSLLLLFHIVPKGSYSLSRISLIV